MELKVKILVKEQQPNTQDWFDTDRGELYYFIDKNVWSCRDDRISDEFPEWWLAEPSSVPQANELLPHVSNSALLEIREILNRTTEINMGNYTEADIEEQAHALNDVWEIVKDIK